MIPSSQMHMRVCLLILDNIWFEKVTVGALFNKLCANANKNISFDVQSNSVNL